MSVLRACLDWRVLLTLGLIGLGIYVLVPGAVVAVLPVLMVAACPLSMLFMMRMMGCRASAADQADDGDRDAASRSELADRRR